MNQEPNIIINIGGDHPAKSIVAGVIADALQKVNVKSINHMDYDSSTFAEMRRAISESSENGLSTASVLIIEWEEDDDQLVYSPQPSTDVPVDNE